jgi:hypothetical protein
VNVSVLIFSAFIDSKNKWKKRIILNNAAVFFAKATKIPPNSGTEQGSFR